MSTPIGNTTPYCTGAQALNYIDARQWGDLLADDGTRVAAASIPTNTVMIELLLNGAGEIELACNKGERYLPSDLATLAASSTASAATLRKLNAAVAFGTGWMRRRPSEPLPAIVVWAYGVLDELSKGAKIFSIQENIDADIPDSAFETAADTWNNIPLATSIASRYYGCRSKYYRPYYGGGGACGGDC